MRVASRSPTPRGRGSVCEGYAARAWPSLTAVQRLQARQLLLGGRELGLGGAICLLHLGEGLPALGLRPHPSGQQFLGLLQLRGRLVGLPVNKSVGREESWWPTTME